MCGQFAMRPTVQSLLPRDQPETTDTSPGVVIVALTDGVRRWLSSPLARQRSEFLRRTLVQPQFYNTAILRPNFSWA